MSNLRKIFYVCLQQFRESLLTQRVWAGYAIGIVLMAVPVYQYVRYAGENPVQVGEGILVALVNPINVFVIFIGLMLSLSDSPFVTPRSAMTICRVPRKLWGYSMALYIFLHTALYFLVLFAVSSLVTCRNGYFGNVWSNIMYRWSMYNGSSALAGYGITAPDTVLVQNYSPVKAVLLSWILLCACGYLMMLLLFVLNLNMHRMVGYAAVLGIQFVGLSVCGNYIMWIPDRFVPLVLSNLNRMVSGGIPFWYSMAVFLLGIIVLISVLEIVVRKSDFRISIGGKME